LAKRKKQPVDARGIFARILPEYILGKLGSGVVRLTPREATSHITRFLPDMLSADNAQEDFSLFTSGALGLIFKLDPAQERGMQKFGEEVLQELYRRKNEMPQGGQGQEGFIRSIFDQHAHLLEDIEKRFKGSQPGKSGMDSLAEDLSAEEQEDWHAMFYSFPPARHTEFLKEMETRKVSASRIRLVMSSPPLKRYAAFRAMLEQAPLLKQQEKGFLDRALTKLGVVTDGAEEKIKEIVSEIKNSRAKTQEKLLNLRRFRG